MPQIYDPTDDTTTDISSMIYDPSEVPPSTPKSELISQTREMSGPSRFLTGMGGGMYGLGLGTVQLGAEVGNKLGVVSGDTVNALRTLGSEHKNLMSSLKLDNPGVFNPASAGEFVGEVLPTIVPGLGGANVSRMAAVQGIKSNMLRNALIGSVSGATAGGTYGAIEPLGTEDQNRGLNIATNAAGGAVFGTALGAAGGKLQDVLATKTGPIVYRIDEYLRRVAPYGTTIRKDIGKRQDAIANRAQGIMNIVKLSDKLTFLDETGAPVTGKLPSTQFELLQAIEQGKDILFNMYDEIAQTAGDLGIKVYPNKVYTYLKSIINDGSGEYTTAQKKYAERMLKDFSTPFTPKGAQGRIAAMNEELANYYTNKDVGFAKNARISKKVLDTFRSEVRETIEKVDDQYGDIRRAWGTINSLEEDALRGYEKELMKRATKSEPLNFLAGEQILYAAAKGNPAYLIPAAGTTAMSKISRYLNNPDRHVKNLFKMVSKEELGNRFIPFVPPAIDRTPRMYDPSTGLMTPAKQDPAPPSKIPVDFRAVKKQLQEMGYSAQEIDMFYKQALEKFYGGDKQ